MEPTINDLMRALVDELAVEGVPAPLGQPFTLAAVWLDLCRLAGEPPPAAPAVVVPTKGGELLQANLRRAVADLYGEEAA